MKHKILLVDDEKDIIDLLKYNLEKEKEFTIEVAYDGKEALKKVETFNPDIVLLDIMMPEMNGLEVCKLLKSDAETSHIPIIFLTAKENEIDEILGLELGADDYIQKPISPRKVLARIKTVLRRKHIKEEESKKTDVYIKFKNIEIDTEAYVVKIDGEEVFFPRKEFKLLHFLLSNRGKVFSREILLDEIWGNDVYVVDRTIDVHVAKLREKLGRYANYIETIKGLGYRFRNE
ncbi:MAG: response regulator [Ignavibacteria bacterium]